MSGGVLKDPDRSHVVPLCWRSTIRDIVEALVAGDYELKAGVTSASPIPPVIAEQIRSQIADYGELLSELPQGEEAWERSAAQWMDGHWEVLLDLWTAESGHSDLALSLRVFETGTSYRFEIDSVHVP
jgi:hypothetical protein